MVNNPATIANCLAITKTLMSTSTTNIESLQHEARVFPPPTEFAAQAHIKSMAELESACALKAPPIRKSSGRARVKRIALVQKWDTF